MTVSEALARGLRIDRHSSPWVAYRGARFDPDELHELDRDGDALDPSVRDLDAIIGLVDAAAAERERAMALMGQTLARADGRLDGLCEALAVLTARPVPELKTEAIARCRQERRTRP